MQALLALYMVKSLLVSDPAAHVVGFGGFQAALEAVFGQLSTQALASQIVGLYGGLVYLTPILGGWIGDRWLGGRRTVLIGAGLMAAGHFLLAFNASFLIALLLLVLGSGCLKGNIATQVGRLYAQEDSRRDRGFLWFNLGINLGAFAGPLVCGGLGDTMGWHWGFASAGVGMLLGIVIYVVGSRHLPPDQRSTAQSVDAPLTAGERQRLLGLLAVIVLILGFNVPFGQAWNVYPLWLADTMNLQVGGFQWPVAWYLAADGLVTVLGTPIVLALWKRQAERGTEPGELGKIAIGSAMMMAADLLLALFSTFGGAEHRLNFAWGYVYFLLSSTAYLFTMPILLALVSRAAPKKLTATMMGLAYFNLFVANLTGGWLGRFYAPLGHAGFWTLNAAIAGVGGLLCWGLRRPLGRILLDRRDATA
jgi:POT family proton-dependent oligopeptide transporter